MTVNNVVIKDPAFQVDTDTDDICFSGRRLRYKETFIYVILNKPPGVLTTVRDDRGRKTVMDLVSLPQRIFPVGRLDFNTRGLLILTNDGDLANRLMHPRYQVSRTYRVDLNGNLDKSAINKLKAGITIGPDGEARPKSIELSRKPGGREVFVTLHEGKKHEIKRMFKAVGFQVRQLERIEYAGIQLKRLPMGAWRHLKSREVSQLKKITAESINNPIE